MAMKRTLNSPVISEAAFFGRRAGQFLVLEKEISYQDRPSAEVSLEQVMTAPGAWISQAEKPGFPLTKDPVSLWARFDLPEVTQPRRVLIDTSPWETVDFFFVRELNT